MHNFGFALAAALAGLALAVAGCGGDDEEGAPDTGTETTTETTDTGNGTRGQLQGTVGPGLDISLSAGGEPPNALTAGSYTLEVNDQSDTHNFHLTGPGGVDVSTSVAEEGTQSFELELEPGTYEFVCDPHASSMNGSFEIRG